MSDDPETQRIIGQLQASVSTLTTEVANLRNDMRKLIELAATAKGGWKTLVAVGAAAASAGATVASIINWIHK